MAHKCEKLKQPKYPKRENYLNKLVYSGMLC